MQDADDALPVLSAPQGTGAITEHDLGADTGITFTLTDADTTISTTATADTTDIDPGSFTITERAGTNAKFAGMFTLAYDEAHSVWRLKLKERMSIDYADSDLGTDKMLHLTIQLTDPESTASATPRNVDIRVVDDGVIPNLSEPQGTGAITENVDGAASGITFTLTAPARPFPPPLPMI